MRSAVCRHGRGDTAAASVPADDGDADASRRLKDMTAAAAAAAASLATSVRPLRIINSICRGDVASSAAVRSANR